MKYLFIIINAFCLFLHQSDVCIGATDSSKNIYNLSHNAPPTYIDSFNSLAAAVTSSSTDGKEVLIAGKIHIITSFTIPKNITLRFAKGGMISVASNKTLTIDCHIEADLKQQILDGPGTITFGWNSDQKVSICWIGANSEKIDNAHHMQWAIDQMSHVQGNVIIPFGNYRYKTPLKIYSNTVLEGQGRRFSSAITPVNCSAITIDGSLVDGGWIFRSKIKNLTIYGDKTNDPDGDKLVYINNAYNIEIENVWIYNQQTSTGLHVKNSGDIVVSDLVLYGKDTGSYRKGIVCENSSIKIISPDVENLYNGIYCAGSGNVDIISPYMERCIVGYRHAVTSGTTRIFGGMISTTNGYCIDVQGDRLFVYGTDLSPYQGPNPGGLGIYAATNAGYANVIFYDIPKAAQPGFFDRNTNWLNFQMTGTLPIQDIFKRTLDFAKSVKNHTTTDIIEFNNIEYANCELRIYAPIVGSSNISKVYHFAITKSSFSPITEQVEVNSGDKSNNIVINISIKKINNSVCRVVIKADGSGKMGGLSIPLNFQLNLHSKSSGNSKVSLL